ncbi:MAG TPA: hydroxyacid dehydrogenase [Tepidimicrobium sp.]|nr:hydroxyacid dehydrogenase [Tepidimicrobium sp.]
MKIVVLESLAVPEDELREIAKPLTDQGHELELYEKTDDIELQKEYIKDADILVIGNMPLVGEVIRSAEKLKYIAVAFTGVDHVDLDACKEKGIQVSNAAGYATVNVAELVVGLMLALLRDIVALDKVTREGGTMGGPGQDLRGKTVGVIGTGAIGYESAKLLLAFGCDVLGYDIVENDELKEAGVKYLPLDDLMKESDLITIHTPLSESTRGLISKEKLELMKSTAFLINCARGPIVDNDALAQVLKDGKIAGAGIDVFDMEPPIPADYPLLSAPNTILTPHIGFFTKEAMVRRAHITFDENVAKWIEGDQQNVIL